MAVNKADIKKHIDECNEEGKEKAKITLANLDEVREAEQILNEIGYNDIYVYKRKMNDYIAVVYEI